MPREDSALLLDMLLSCQKIQKFTQDISEEKFKENDLVQSATLREFQVLGEVARMISDDGKVKHENIPWRIISGLRNRVIHEYFNVDLDILWQTIQENIPELKNQLEEIIPAENEE